ncbi:MAG: GDP-mannose 4,6-dehydratase, partial [Actinomycetota bacterium]|nr:GDP-mannose 4,6-dehydratase [Actinomycetota bacterium]
RRGHHVDTGIVRIFNTYGPAMRDDDGGVVSTFIQQALDGEPLTVAGDGHQTRSLCYVEDTVDAIVRMGMSLHPGPLNVGNPEETSILGLAEQIIKITRSSSVIEFVERSPDDLDTCQPDVSMAGAQLGWRPRTDLATGLGRTVHGEMVARLLRDASAFTSTEAFWGLQINGSTVRVH